MDYWDPAVTDGLARDREVILFNNAGVSSSAGKVPTSFHEMGANAVAFIKALGLTTVDVLGFSIGGMVAQEVAAQGPDLVRRLILAGTPVGSPTLSSMQMADPSFERAPERIMIMVETIALKLDHARVTQFEARADVPCRKGNFRAACLRRSRGG
jgi:pimeloyl-ACP methyl ester carboxylesterase